MKKLLYGFLISLFLISQGYCANEWQKGTGEDVILGTESASDIDTISFNNIVDPLDRLLAKYKQGCELVYATAGTVTVNAGSVTCQNSTGTIKKFRQNTSNTTVTLSSGLDTGSEASSTTYYVYAIGDADATTFTCIVSASSSAPTGASYSYYKRLGSFYNDSNSNITQIANDEVPVNAAYVKGQGNYYKIDSGSVAISAESTASPSFSFTFASAPIVVATLLGSSSDLDHTMFLIRSISTTGFTLYQHEGESVTGYWIAIGQVLAQ